MTGSPIQPPISHALSNHLSHQQPPRDFNYEERDIFPSSYALKSESDPPTPTSNVLPASDTSPFASDVTDRIFPIRSVLEGTQQAPRSLSRSPSYIGRPNGGTEAESRSGEGSWSQPNSRPTSITAWRRPSVPSPAEIYPPKVNYVEGSIQGGAAASPIAGCENNGYHNDVEVGVTPELVTPRHGHVMTEEGHVIVAVVTGVASVQSGEHEPIHSPSSVQGFGVLVALKADFEGKLAVRVVSGNSKRILGYSPSALFLLGSFTDILSGEHAENFSDNIDFARELDPMKSGPDVFPVTVVTPEFTEIKLWCAMHISDRNPGLIICEFELENDQLFPLAIPTDDINFTQPENVLGLLPTDEEFLESTVSTSKPLRKLRNARKHHGEAAAMEIFNLMSDIYEQLSAANDLETLLKLTVGIVKELTGFHRVMIYQFDEEWNRRVVAELVDPRLAKELYRGLQFPASDIPKPARDLYKLCGIRLIYDLDQETARLVYRTLEDLAKPLDMTFSYLRSMNPIHIKYLRDMGVRASMNISLSAFDEHWGLISCHTYGQRGMRVNFPIRKMCRLIGDAVGRSIERLSYASRLQARKLINMVPTEQNPSEYLVESSDDLLKLFDADFGLLSIKDETKVLGKLEHYQEALALLEYLRMKDVTSVVVSQDLKKDFPDLKYPPGFSVIAGLLLVPLSISDCDFIVFFRKVQMECVRWVRNPYEKTPSDENDGYLEPRNSFKIWTETVMGKCRKWTPEQIETASVLCLVYGKFLEVWRQKEAALRSSRLTRILIANASHEVRTPLNAIINFLEIALEGPLDTETRENITRSHSASVSLTYLINDLLDLTRTEEGHELVKKEFFNLIDTINAAICPFKSDATRKGLSLEITKHLGLPKLVMGDKSRVRQAITNIVANAIQHTTHGGVKIEIWASRPQLDQCEVEISVQDTGKGMSTNELDILFRELEQVSTEDDALVMENGLTFDGFSKLAGQKILGLGLAVVARIVTNMNGQLRIKSEKDKGSQFTINVPFSILPHQDEEYGVFHTKEESSSLIQPPHMESIGEMLVLNKTAGSIGSRTAELKGKISVEGTNTFVSQDSGKNEIGRLLDDLSSSQWSNSAPKIGITRRSKSLSTEPTFCLSSLSSPSSPSSPPMELKRSSSTAVLSVNHLQPSPMPPEPQSGQKYGVPAKPLGVPTPTSPPSVKNPIIPLKRVGQNNVDVSKKLLILIAEDNPINSKVMKKRLEKMGHECELTVNGEECLGSFTNDSGSYDVVLMDMQMPIMDGGTSTTLIRAHEKLKAAGGIPEKRQLNGRIPIFAVSASLVEERKEEYIKLGFDGWILKPVDFRRLDTIMTGIVDPTARRETAYSPGQWLRGGWFAAEADGVGFDAVAGGVGIRNENLNG
ncbi:hypothetical protein RUND412_007980 [Rhizina undulata]